MEIKVKGRKIEDLKFSISEWKRFYTQAIRGKQAISVPQLVARICGTCSNAHLLASIEAVEKGSGITPSPQTMTLRKLLNYGLIIRDHALHLYIFSLPDIFKKNSILDFDENNPEEHQFLDDAFSVKEVGNQLSIIIGGRSVHAPNPAVGGFKSLPNLEKLKNLIPKLKEIRPKILKIIEVFSNSGDELKIREPIYFSGLVSSDFSFLEGEMKNGDKTIPEAVLGSHLKGIVIPYSHARGFSFEGKLMMVGALARLNLSKDHLHPQTKIDCAKYLEKFPSSNLFDNSVAQAIEVLHAIDSSITLIENTAILNPEPLAVPEFHDATGIGVIEAPRGTLYYELELTREGVVKKGEIIVPTGQNQVLMERGIREVVEKELEKGSLKEKIVDEVEKFIRAFDPCMSCAAHFLKVKWR